MVSEDIPWQVVVIGAGAAGLLAAARAAERGRRTLLLEKNRRAGVKILMSGGTRCNLTQNTDAAGIIAAYGPPGRFLHSALARLNPQQLVALFECEGVATKVESTGKIFPQSDRAADVLDALLRRIERSGAVLQSETAVTQIERAPGGFRVQTTAGKLSAEKLIVTTGGKSYPGSGTTGDGYAWLAALGHTIVTPRPALTPITTRAAWLLELQGVTIADVDVRVFDTQPGAGKRKPLAQRREAMLFTHFGLSGPAILDVSRAITAHREPTRLELVCDFLPDVYEEELDRRLRDAATAAGKKQLLAILPVELPRRLLMVLLQLAELNADARAAELAKEGRRRLVQMFKRLSIPVQGARGFKKAEVTAGGASLSEVDSRSMQSKLVPGLFLAGEILDLDGPIGGYNFQAAFSTGLLAGESV